MFDITLVDENGNPVQPGTEVTVRIPFRKGLTPKKVFHFGKNFEISEELDFEVIDGAVVFKTTSFSYFGIQYAETPGDTDGTSTSDDTASDGDLPATGSSIILPLIGGTSLVMAGLGVELFRKKRQQK